MFGRVIVGVDGREGGHDAIALARRLAAPRAAVTFAHVYGVPTAAGRAGALALPLELETAERLVGLEAKRSGLVAKPAAVYGSSVARGLHRLSEEAHADLLVVGSCHRGLIGRTVLGNDTISLLSGAPCAVAIAPRRYAAVSSLSLGLARIGVGCAASLESARALEVAGRLGDRYSAVVELSAVSPESDPGQELAASSPDLDLLVVGSRDYGPVGWVFAGSTTRYLAAHASCPLLLLPRSAGEQLRTATAPAHSAEVPR